MRNSILKIIRIFLLLVITQCSTFEFELTTSENDAEACKNCDCCIENRCKSADNCKNISIVGIIVMVSIIVIILVGFVICYFIQKKRDLRNNRSFRRRLQEIDNSSVINNTHIGSGTTNNISYLDDTVLDLLFNHIIFLIRCQWAFL